MRVAAVRASLLLCAAAQCTACSAAAPAAARSPGFEGLRSAAITGAASGIGFALARKCLRSGISVVVSDGDAERLDRAADALQAEAAAAGCRLERCVVDVRREEDMQRLLKCCTDAFGSVDIFFNNAGVIGEPSKGVLDTSLVSWRWVLDTNVMGLLNGMHTFVPAMQAQGTEAHIVNTASGAGLYSQHRPTMGPYVASKHCAVVLTQAMKTELESQKSAVVPHLLCPSVVATPLVETSRFYQAQAHGTTAADLGDLDEISKQFHQRLNADGMPPDKVADLVFDAVREKRFWIMPHPVLTEQRITDRYNELVGAARECPRTGY
jgi:NAD(P)-dependent dehydrogenase (short-subunit alcohol dehydrogenase family)